MALPLCAQAGHRRTGAWDLHPAALPLHSRPKYGRQPIRSKNMSREKLDSLLKPLVKTAVKLEPRADREASVASCESKFGGSPYALLLVVLLLASCGTLETKTGGSYEKRKQREGREKMWGCPYSGTKLDSVIIQDSSRIFPHWVGILGITYGTVDIIFSVILDTIFFPVDYAHRELQDRNFDELCVTPYRMIEREES